MTRNKLPITPIPDMGTGPIQDETGRWLLEARDGGVYDPFGTEEGLEGHRVIPVGNPDEEGEDRFGERSFKGEEATTAFDRLNGHAVCGGEAGFQSSLAYLFDGPIWDKPYN